MTEQYATDTSPDGEEEEKLQEPIKVEITNQPKEKEKPNLTSYDTVDELYDIVPTDEEIKEMIDAQ